MASFFCGIIYAVGFEKVVKIECNLADIEN